MEQKNIRKMKKSLLLLFGLLAFGTASQAQTSGGPDSYGYVWRDSNDPNGPVYNWIDVATLGGATEITGLADDNFVGPFPLPAPFPFYWYSVNQFYVGSNGFMSFNGGNIASPFPLIPSTAAPQNYIAGLLGDLTFEDTGNPGQAYRWTSTAGDSVILAYYDVPFWANAVPTYTGSNTFEIILNYNDSTITLQYLNQNGASAATVDYCTVGIENTSGAVGLMWNHDVYPPSQYAIRFYAPASTTLQINDASTEYNDNPDNGARFLSANGPAFPLNISVKNSGNTTLAAFNVNTILRNAANVALVNSTVSAGPLNAGATQQILLPSTFTPATPGTYRMITTTQQTPDAVPSNNARTLELQVVDTTAASILLSYDNGQFTGAGLSWSGGNGGVANYFIPPFYPALITKTRAYIVSDANAVGYAMMIFDDDGLNGAAGTMLDSVAMMPGTFQLNQFDTTALATPDTIFDGGFYVCWYMLGDAIQIGNNLGSTTNPVSNRSFEVLGTGFSDYRSRETEDLMVNAIITNPVPVGMNEIIAAEGAGNFYPNPSSDISYLDLKADAGSDAVLSVFDASGKMIYSSKAIVRNNRIQLDTHELAAGIYTVQLKGVSINVSRKLSVVH